MKTFKNPDKPSLKTDAVSARKVLRDAYFARNELTAAIKDGSTQRTRLAWITCITLLRAVGHVLDKVDADRSTYVKQASDLQFSKTKADRFANLIFWEFIEAERNQIIKEYKSSIFDYVPDDLNGGKDVLVVTNILIGIQVFTPGEAVSAAIHWWEEYLDAVEFEARQIKEKGKFQRRNARGHP